jgi:hypothetical protein
MLGVHFRRVVMVVGRVQRMAVRDFRMVRRFFVMPGLVMLGRFAMMLRRLLVMMRGLLVVLVNVVIHHPLLGWDAGGLQALMKHLRPAYCRTETIRQAAPAMRE